MRSSRGEVCTEAVPADVFHALLVREGGNGCGGIIPHELLVEEDEICEAPSRCRGFFLEGLEGGLLGRRERGRHN